MFGRKRSSAAVTVTDLTPSQAQAVEHDLGPLLVLAGPGSGKTRVITRRIARLVERGVPSRQILAITFTNKAAREMADRLARLLPGERVWVTTFHKFCARILRERGSVIGLQPNFSIFDTSDQQQLLRQVLHDEDLDTTHFPPSKVGWQISQAKNELITPEQFSQRYEEHVGNHLQAVVARVYPKYQQRLLAANAVDFDDLLVHVAVLLQEHAALREQLDQRFRYILVDEYQDTNRAQYQIVAALSQRHPNLCATGDPDQSIYGWRGAQIENILRFERDFPEVTVIRLEENFRSSPEILKAADELIARNRRRKPKVLKATHPPAGPVRLWLHTDGREEAAAIAGEMRHLVDEAGLRWSDFAVFYRVNALSRTLETALAAERVPYQVAAGVAFYERTEIKDLLAYLRLIENPADRIAFLRVVNTPTRGIGKSSVDRLMRRADRDGIGLLEAARQADQVPELTRRAALALMQFARLIDDLARTVGRPIAELLSDVLARTGYGRGHEGVLTSEDQLQLNENVQELLTAARQYDLQNGEEGFLGGFLESASLAQDLDAVDTDRGAVTLMTLHAAKGLEFPHVYVIGVEQNLLPHERAIRDYDPEQIEEERRLLFVGITRAERQLTLSHTVRREMHGRSVSTIRSMFLDEMTLFETDGSRWRSEPFQPIERGELVPSRAQWKATDAAAEAAVPLPEPLSKPMSSATGTSGASASSTSASSTSGISESAAKSPRPRSANVQAAVSSMAGLAARLTTGAALLSSRQEQRVEPAGADSAAAAGEVSPPNETPTAESSHGDGEPTHPAGLTGSPRSKPSDVFAAVSAKASASTPVDDGPLSLGKWVRHPKYGVGQVTEQSSGSSRHRVITVQFAEPRRQEQFIVSKCPLVPLDEDADVHGHEPP
jgi:DNA helicase II / ATP-dependent DNA helicase PcrA